jgi:hypothetical protein
MRCKCLMFPHVFLTRGIMRERREILCLSVPKERGCAITMAERKRQPVPGLLVQDNQPLIGIPFEEQGQEVVRYFAGEEEADRAVADQEVQDALSLAGAWSHLDWDDMVDALDRIRHESKPTPPIEL